MDIKKYIDYQQDENNIKLAFHKRTFYYLGIGFLLITVLGLTAFSWGMYRQYEILHLREKIQVQDEQLKLVDEKTKVLEKRLEQLDILDKELRQMVTGAETGSTPQGGPTPEQAKKLTRETKNTQLNMDNILQRVYNAQKDSDKRLISLLTLRNLMQNNGAERIRQLQSQFSPLGYAKDEFMPNIWPSKGSISSLFGIRNNPITGVRTLHSGVDIANDYGTPVIATATGKIVVADYEDGYGLIVGINHGNGFETRYGHLSSILTTVGQEVKRGDVIGLMGSTGNSTGSHVHYEVIINGEHTDPILFMKTF